MFKISRTQHHGIRGPSSWLGGLDCITPCPRNRPSTMRLNRSRTPVLFVVNRAIRFSARWSRTTCAKKSPRTIETSAFTTIISSIENPLVAGTTRPNSRVSGPSATDSQPYDVDTRFVRLSGSCSHVVVTTRTLPLALYGQRRARVRSFVSFRRNRRAASQNVATVPGQALQPWDVLKMDLMSSGVTSIANQKYVLLVDDRASRLPPTFPLPYKQEWV